MKGDLTNSGAGYPISFEWSPSMQMGPAGLPLIDLAVASSFSAIRSQVFLRCFASRRAVKRPALPAKEGMLASHMNHSWLSGVSVRGSPKMVARLWQAQDPLLCRWRCQSTRSIRGCYVSASLCGSLFSALLPNANVMVCMPDR
jgi:hypothetical protein